MRRTVLPGLVGAALAAGAAPAGAHEGHCAEPPAPVLQAAGVRAIPLASFVAPTHVARIPGTTDLAVVERAGRVRVLRGDRILRRPLLDLRRELAPAFDTPPDEPSERGMQSIAFAPDYERSRRFYVHFTGRSGDARIDEFGPRGHRRRLLVQEHSRTFIHYGGQLAFGPRGRLYASFGDAVKRSAVQDDRLYGKLIRLDPRRPRRYRLLARGLRNPFRFTIDRTERRIFITDVGEAFYDELDVLPLRTRGARPGTSRAEDSDVVNFGWPVYEGFERFPKSSGEAPGHVPPALAFSHRDGWHAMIGGHIVRDPALPALTGRFVHGDFCTGAVWSVVLEDGVASNHRPAGLTIPRLTGFAEDAQGRTLVVSLAGWVYRLEAG